MRLSLKFPQIAQDIRTLHDTLCRFKSILVDPAEFACLKAIVLFRSEAKGLKDATQIENLQDQAQVIDMPPELQFDSNECQNPFR